MRGGSGLRGSVSWTVENGGKDHSAEIGYKGIRAREARVQYSPATPLAEASSYGDLTQTKGEIVRCQTNQSCKTMEKHKQ